MPTETSTETGLTTADIRMIRGAERLIFKHSGGVSTLTAWYGIDKSLSIRVDCWFKQYGAEGSRIDDPRDRASCFASVPCRLDGATRTFTHLLKKGDQVVIRWIRDCDNGATRAAGLVQDKVEAVILRGGKSVDPWVIPIDDYTGPDESCRIVRRAF